MFYHPIWECYFISLSSVWQYGSNSSFLLVPEMAHFHLQPILPVCLYDIVYSDIQKKKSAVFTFLSFKEQIRRCITKSDTEV